MPHNPGRTELSGLLCSESQLCRAVRVGDLCRCGWPRPRVGPLCWSHLPQPPSEQYHATGFHNCSAPDHPAAASRARDALWSGKCHALEGVQAKAAVPCSVSQSGAPQSSGVWGSSYLGACRGSRGQCPARGERCSLLLLKSHPKGCVFAQLLVASSGLLFLSHDSAWHVWEPVLETEQESLACWVVCNA